MKSHFSIVASIAVTMTSAYPVGAAGGSLHRSAEGLFCNALLERYCVACHNERIVSGPVDPDASTQVTQLLRRSKS